MLEKETIDKLNEILAAKALQPAALMQQGLAIACIVEYLREIVKAASPLQQILHEMEIIDSHAYSREATHLSSYEVEVPQTNLLAFKGVSIVLGTPKNNWEDLQKFCSKKIVAQLKEIKPEKLSKDVVKKLSKLLQSSELVPYKVLSNSLVIACIIDYLRIIVDMAKAE